MNNNIIIPDEKFTSYENNEGPVFLSDPLFSGAATVTGICVDHQKTDSNTQGSNTLTEVNGCEVTVPSISNASGTLSNTKKPEDFGLSGSFVLFDKDTQEKVWSYSELSDEQRFTLGLALQYKKIESSKVIVITDSNILKKILDNEGISTVGYKESGLLYNYSGCFWRTN